MKPKVILAGGTGFIGNYLNEKYTNSGYEVIVISRSGKVQWSDKKAIAQALEGATLVINPETLDQFKYRHYLPSRRRPANE